MFPVSERTEGSLTTRLQPHVRYHSRPLAVGHSQLTAACTTFWRACSSFVRPRVEDKVRTIGNLAWARVDQRIHKHSSYAGVVS
jgi:hypothetical protein